MKKNKIKNLIENKMLNKEILKNLKDHKFISDNAIIALKNELIQRALMEKKINVDDVMNISNYGLEALSYPSIKKCINHKMKKINLFFSNFSIKQILEIDSQEELDSILAKSQKMIKRHPKSWFTIPTHLHDEFHRLEKKFLLMILNHQ